MCQRILALVAIALLFSSPLFVADRPVIDVWPGKVPGETKDIGPEESLPPRPNQRQGVTRITNISKPTLTLFQPPEGKRNGATVIVCPGGGYSYVTFDLEGTEIAEWLNSIGVTAAVLK